MSHWTGTANFLSKGKANWIDSVGSAVEINWNFIEYKSLRLPFITYECVMSGWTFFSQGTGVAQNRNEAIRKAFAEAWERIWVKKLCNSKSWVDRHPDLYLPMSSNGFAAGDTDLMAQTNARNELIERAIFLKAWSEKSGWQTINFKKLKNKITALGMRLKGFEPHLYSINSNCGTVLACLCFFKKGISFDTKLVFALDDAETAVLHSVLKSSQIEQKTIQSQLPEVGVPEDHLNFYATRSAREAFDFLSKSNSTLIELQNVENITGELIVPAGQFPAVAYAFNAHWQPLCWGRKSITGGNLWPHPLA